MRTLYTNTRTVRALPITTIAIDGIRYGSSIDLAALGMEFRSVLFVINTGNITDGTYVVTAEDSDDDITYTAVDSSRIQGSTPTIVSTDDFRVEGLDFGVIPVKRYLHLKVVASGTSSGGVIGATAVLAGASLSPVLRTGS